MLTFHSDTPVNSSYLDGDDFANFFQDNYNINSTKGIALTPGNYTVSQFPHPEEISKIYQQTSCVTPVSGDLGQCSAACVHL